MLLREARERAKLTQEELARKANVTASTVYKLESGRSTPSYGSLRRLAEALGVPAGDLEFPEREGKEAA